jgi:hypothetical protein
VKQNRQLARVVAEFLETAAKEMPPDQADLLRRSAQLMLEQHAAVPAIAAKRESTAQKPEAAVKPVSAPVREKGVSVLDELLGIMLTEGNAVDKIIRAVTERQRQLRENGSGAGETRVELKFSRPAGQKVGITMNEHFDIEELKKDLAAVHRLGFNCVAGYAC